MTERIILIALARPISAPTIRVLAKPAADRAVAASARLRRRSAAGLSCAPDRRRQHRDIDIASPAALMYPAAARFVSGATEFMSHHSAPGAREPGIIARHLQRSIGGDQRQHEVRAMQRIGRALGKSNAAVRGNGGDIGADVERTRAFAPASGLRQRSIRLHRNRSGRWADPWRLFLRRKPARRQSDCARVDKSALSPFVGNGGEVGQKFGLNRGGAP